MKRQQKEYTHVFIGYFECGCPLVAITDMGDAWTRKEVAALMTGGGASQVKRMTFDEYRTFRLGHVPTCQKLKKDTELFEVQP